MLTEVDLLRNEEYLRSSVTLFAKALAENFIEISDGIELYSAKESGITYEVYGGYTKAEIENGCLWLILDDRVFLRIDDVDDLYRELSRFRVGEIKVGMLN